MAISKQKKQDVIVKLKDILGGATSFVFVAFRALKVGDTTAMRKALTGKGVGYMVAKKTLLARALQDSKFEGTVPELKGEIALAYGRDILAPAREIYEAAKKHKDALSIVGGIFEGAYVGKEKILSLALIPPREVLYGQFANLLISPIQRFAIALSKIAEKKA